MRDETKASPAALTRREVLKATSLASLAAAFHTTGGAFAAYASERIRVGLIGCGGRGTGAAVDCVNASPDIVITALGDLFPDQVEWAKGEFRKQLPAERVTATPETSFSGFDAFRKVLATDCDLVILATPPFFRPAHLAAAIEAGKHVFTEKPVAVDPAGVRSVIATSELAAKKGRAIVAGTQRRHQAHYVEIMNRIRAGDIGEIVAGEAYWNMGGLLDREAARRPELVRHGMAGAELAVYFVALGRSHRRAARAQSRCDELGVRRAPGQVRRHGRPAGPYRAHVWQHLRPLLGGLRVPERRAGPQHVPADGRCGGERVRARGRDEGIHLHRQHGRPHHGREGVPEPGKDSPNPYVQEHADLIASIRAGKPLNEGRRVAESTLTAIMGRMSAYTGRAMSWDWVMNASTLDLTPPHLEFKALPPLEVAVPGKTELT